MKDGDTDLLDAVGAGILIFINDKVVYANKALARIFGYAQPSHILDLPSYMELVATHDRGRVGKYSAARLSGHDAPASYEFQAIHSDGRLIYLSNQPVLIQWGGMVATLATVMDITPLKSTEQGLRQSEQISLARRAGKPASLIWTKRNCWPTKRNCWPGSRSRILSFPGCCPMARWSISALAASRFTMRRVGLLATVA